MISVGEVLWDVMGTAEHLGGAPFNFAAHARRLGHDVWFVSAVGRDERGGRILSRMEELGLSTRYLRQTNEAATGLATVALGPDGQPGFVIHRPAAYDFASLSRDEAETLSSEGPDWICFGTLFQTSRRGRETVRALTEQNSGARRFYDVNLRPNSYNASLVGDLLTLATDVKLNDSELRELDALFGQAYDTLEGACRGYAERFALESICVTRASLGCAALVGGEFVVSDGYQVEVADAVGAGDAFAAAFVHGASMGWAPAQMIDFANRIGALVASRPGAVPPWTIEEAESLVRRGEGR